MEETVIDAVAFVSINVADQDRAKKFYTEQLGFELVQDVPMGDPGDFRWIEVCPPGARTRVVLFHNPEGTGSFGPCVFDTDDITATADDLKSKGVEIIEDPRIAEWGTWWARFRDSEGNEIGLGQQHSAS
jgi:predicted enzyme related to lactoylglutathione lyase